MIEISKTRRSLVLSASVAAALVGFNPVTASAQDALEEVIITGTRAQARSITESPAPVDILDGEDFVNQGGTDLSNLIRNIVPSFNVNAQPISDAATIVRPANLRGLAPDHTLVLVNSKRRHRAAVIYWLGNGVADGAQGPDISVIPAIALKQVEVLRDGAAAQYGSDAIAGVMNFILKDDAEGATFEARYGSTFEGDGDIVSIAGNIGLPFTDKGFVNLSGEYGSADATDRSVQRDDAAGLIAAGNTNVLNPAQIWGSPQIDDDLKLMGNMGLDLGGGREFYAHANYATKAVDGGFYFRNPNTRGGVFSNDSGASLLIGDLLDAVDGIDDGSANCPQVPVTNNVPDQAALAQVLADPNCFTFQEIFPGGFTPRFGGKVNDAALTAGLRGEFVNGIRYDFSVAGGRNEVDFFINNTVNASLGPATPTNFNPGAYVQLDQQINADFGKEIADGVNLAFGAEYRQETFEIKTGQQESFEIGPLASQGFGAASNGFPGFSPIAGGEFSRGNVALYVDGEWEVNDQLLLGAALRWEDFQDFGTTTNGKVAFNWRANDQFGLRGTFGTGFKAPTPGQSNAFNVSTEFDLVLNDLVNNGTVPSTSAAAVLRGGQSLSPEDSTSFTLGTFFNVGALDITIDYFNIEVDDRINLSQNFELTPAEVTQLVDEGVSSAANLQNFRFFVNDFDTKTSGFDVVATYPIDWAAGNTNISLAFNTTETEVTAFNAQTIDDVRIRELQEGLPETRWTLTGNHFYNEWRFLARISSYDDWYDSEDGNTYDGKMLLDVEAAYNLNDNMTIVVGANNLLDEYPDENPGAAGGVGNTYSQFTPFGFNGGSYYARFRFAL